MEKKYYIAFDLGATSGRTILGTLGSDGSLSTEELTRFPNSMIEIHGRLHWNIYSLFEHIKDGLRAASARGVKPASIGIDTWGVDFGCIAPDGSIAALPRAYRDASTVGAHERFFRDVMSAHDLYNLTGIQHIGFNTIFQFNEQRDTFAMLHAEKIAFLPDLLAYLLTGNLVTEYTIASTGSLLDPVTRTFATGLLSRVGLDEGRFGTMVEPGTTVGMLTSEISRETGMEAVPVVAVAGHDTASAVAAIPAEGENWAYLSSGTWSLMGIETRTPVINELTEAYNITNEGGVDGTVRLLKNITGMWLVEQCLKVWKSEGFNYSYPEMVKMAQEAEPFVCFLDPDAPDFVCPENMPAAIDAFCERTGQRKPVGHGEYIRSIFESLALTYRRVLDVFRRVSPNPIEKLHVIGGGSKNALLNSFTASSTGVPVIAGPAECSALGNIMIQARADGAVKSLDEMRRIIGQASSPVTFLPEDSAMWEEAYGRFMTTLKNN